MQAEKQALRIKLRRAGGATEPPAPAMAAASLVPASDAEVAALQRQLEADSLAHQRTVTDLRQQLNDCRRQLDAAQERNGPQDDQLQLEAAPRLHPEAHDQQQQQQQELRHVRRQFAQCQQLGQSKQLQLEALRRQLDDAQLAAAAARESEGRLRFQLTHSESLPRSDSPNAPSPQLQQQQQQQQQQPSIREQGQQANIPSDNALAADAAAVNSSVHSSTLSPASSLSAAALAPEASQPQPSTRIAAATASSFRYSSVVEQSRALSSGASVSDGRDAADLLQRLLPWRLPAWHTEAADMLVPTHGLAGSCASPATPESVMEAATKLAAALAAISRLVAALAEQKRNYVLAVDMLQVLTMSSFQSTHTKCTTEAVSLR